MSIATSAHRKISLRQERNPTVEQRQAKAISLLRSLRVRKVRQTINISPPDGAKQNNLSLPFE